MSRTITEQIFDLREDEPHGHADFREFQARILVVDPETIIGVRTPALRTLARRLRGTDEAESFMRSVPHRYHEEKQLHSFLIGGEMFSAEHIIKVAAFAGSAEYYVRMMVAWYLSFALVKQWTATLPLIESKTLPRWTHNKTIQKAVESFRITAESKAYLKTLRFTARFPHNSPNVI